MLVSRLSLRQRRTWREAKVHSRIWRLWEIPKEEPKKGHRKEPDLYAALDEKGNVIDLRIIGGTFSLDVDPDTGINQLVG